MPGIGDYPTSNQFTVTTCPHGVDLRLVPRCYLCSPAERDEAIWQVTPSGHVHKGKWCALCVEHGRVSGDVERLHAAIEAALPCEDPEEPCDADGRDDHLWCDFCIARAVAGTHIAAIAREYAALSTGTPKP